MCVYVWVCNECVSVCLGFVMCGLMYVCVLKCVNVYVCGFCNMWVGVCVGF